MPLIEYEEWSPRGEALRLVDLANEICADYARQGYDLTLRQLYYQMVSRDEIPNTDRSYKNLGATISRARMSGLLDWRYITDRGRNLAGGGGWDRPSQIVDTYRDFYGVDHWEGQPLRVEVWVEKDALSGVVARACSPLNAPYVACKGYMSQSEMWAAGQRIVGRWEVEGQGTTILHLGDHDPSGIDMSRDIRERLAVFVAHHSPDAAYELAVKRIALNMAQVERYGPPPNPAKVTDSRATGYMSRFGSQSWELDALPPQVLADLIRSHVEPLRDMAVWERHEARQEAGRRQLAAVADRWDDVVDFLGIG